MSYRSQNFFYQTFSYFYYYFDLNNPKLLEKEFDRINNTLNSKEFINHQKLYAEDIYDFVKSNSTFFRKNLINRIILPKEIVYINTNEPTDNFESKRLISKKGNNEFLIKTKFYEINNFGILEKGNNKKLFIFNGGHGDSRIPVEYEKLIKLKKQLKKNGYDILTLSIAGIGYNRHNNNIYFPTNPNLNREKISKKSFNTEIFGHTRYLRHIWLDFYDENYPELLPISLILSGNYYIIKALENNYDEIVMVGLSGGGWQTTMISSLIPKINYSFSFAGSIPKAFADPHWNPHALMGGNSPFWNNYDIWNFYFLSLFDENGIQNRKHNLIYGKDDQCCFYPPYGTSFEKLVKILSIKGFDVDILENHGHHIKNDYLIKKLIK